jgi:hypothetical protein
MSHGFEIYCSICGGLLEACPVENIIGPFTSIPNHCYFGIRATSYREEDNEYE